MQTSPCSGLSDLSFKQLVLWSLFFETRTPSDFPDTKSNIQIKIKFKSSVSSQQISPFCFVNW